MVWVVGNDINKKYTFFSNDQVIKDDAIKKLRLSDPLKTGEERRRTYCYLQKPSPSIVRRFNFPPLSINKRSSISLHFDNGSFLKIQTELTTNKRERAGGVWKSHWNLKFKNVALRFDCFLLNFRKRCIWSTQIGIWKPRLPTKLKSSYRSLLILIKFTFT